jgi:hypothetical protein
MLDGDDTLKVRQVEQRLFIFEESVVKIVFFVKRSIFAIFVKPLLISLRKWAWSISFRLRYWTFWITPIQIKLFS